jgi:rhodanese-related sulfurtransferase
MRILLITVLIIAGSTIASGQKKEYVCSPCNNSCDKQVYDKPGTCPSCHMKLVLKSSLTFSNLTPEEFCTRIAANPKAFILDVRSPGEFKGRALGATYGHFKNAININITELENRLKELEKYKDLEILIYCSHSIRSPQACALLKENGFANVSNMAGGVSTIDKKLTDCLKNNYVEH